MALTFALVSGRAFGEELEESENKDSPARFPEIERLYEDSALLGHYICQETLPCDVLMISGEKFAIVIFDDEGPSEVYIIKGAISWLGWARAYRFW